MMWRQEEGAVLKCSGCGERLNREEVGRQGLLRGSGRGCYSELRFWVCSRTKEEALYSLKWKDKSFMIGYSSSR